jgi:predicted transcriptional regulator of viral defense system
MFGKAVSTLRSNETIQAMLRDSNGFITTAQVTAAGIQRRALGELVAEKRVYRVTRGIYALPETWEDEIYFLQYRFAKGIFSHGTALYLHGITDMTPHKYTLTFPQGYNAAGLMKHNAKARYAVLDIFDLGITEKPSPSGNLLRVYDIERTLCDIVKGNNSCDTQLVNHAMKAYVGSKEKDIGKLISYAERLRVKSKILRYIEILM